MYIRTKDGVYEVKVNKYHELVYKKDNQIILSKDIIKQSDTIEELCDEFVRVCQPNTKYEWHTLLKDKNDRTLILNEHIDYGAIWTSKGLIYVAKMNSKGELELI